MKFELVRRVQLVEPCAVFVLDPEANAGQFTTTVELETLATDGLSSRPRGA